MRSNKISIIRTAMLGFLWFIAGFNNSFSDIYHTAVLDDQDKIIPWYSPVSHAFDNYLNKCWAWAISAPEDQHGLPISFLYCAWSPGDPPTINPGWENDVGEKIPNWVESARLHYQYTGSMAALDYVKELVDYSLEYGQTPSDHAWPNFPVGTSNAGDTEFRGFTQVFSLWDCHVDLAADIGWALTRMYEIYGDTRYRDKAIHTADVLSQNIVAGNETDSPWPYVINSQDGSNTCRYASSWDGALLLFDFLIENDLGNVSDYTQARSTLKTWLLEYPMTNGRWVDGHSDVFFDHNNNLSATCGSDMNLYMYDHPDWDPDFMTHAPGLIQWSIDNFVNVSTPDGQPGEYYGAYVPAEQTAYMWRMGYQAARLGAQCAQWYAVSGDETYKDLAYRCLSYNTYMMQENGQSSDGPTGGVGYWWSDCYGEATRMYYYGMGAIPEWAPSGENHILYSHATLKEVYYGDNQVSYASTDNAGTEFLRLAFMPVEVTVQGTQLTLRDNLEAEGYTLRELGEGDYALTIRRTHPGEVIVSSVASGLTDKKKHGTGFEIKNLNGKAILSIHASGLHRVDIYNQAGKSIVIFKSGAANVYDLTKENLPSGVYLLRIHNKDSSTIQTVTIY
jgi:hypothetical protein